MPELPPAVDLESRDILKACISAMAELSNANALVKTLPNEEVLINTLPLQEARRSSEIENIITTNMDEQDVYSTSSIWYIKGCWMYRSFTSVVFLSKIGMRIIAIFVKSQKTEVGSSGFSIS